MLGTELLRPYINGTKSVMYDAAASRVHSTHTPHPANIAWKETHRESYALTSRMMASAGPRHPDPGQQLNQFTCRCVHDRPWFGSRLQPLRRLKLLLQLLVSGALSDLFSLIIFKALLEPCVLPLYSYGAWDFDSPAG